MTTPLAPPDTVGVCGAFCRACGLFLGSTEEPARLEAFAKRTNRSPSEVTCHGCRSDVVCGHCRACKLRACAEGKGLSFCADCTEFPCAEIDALASKDITGQLIADCRAIKEHGWEAWCSAKAADFSCPSCGTLNSAYDLTCRKCGHDPSNPLVGRHKDALARFSSANK
jgi:hypothetical protein